MNASSVSAFCQKLERSRKLYQQQMGDSASGKLVQQKKELIANRSLVAERSAKIWNRSKHAPTRSFYP
jgi:hypothetical protein